MLLARVTLLAFTLGACAYTAPAFSEDYANALCDNLETCADTIVAAYTSSGVDEATARSTYEANWLAVCEVADDGATDTASPPGCAFDADAARACLAAIEDAGCGVWTGAAPFPAACADACGATP